MLERKIAGLLFFLAGSVIFLGILTAEIFYPVNYSIAKNMISNLASTPPPHSIIREPSAKIFDNAMVLTGGMILFGAYLIYKSFRKKIFTLAMIFLGLGTFGVGLFPAFHAIIHPIIALIAFLGGGTAAMLSSRITQNPFSTCAIIFGVLSLLFLFSGLFLPREIVPILGAGGTERWVAYPIIVWLIGFGGYLMNEKKLKNPQIKH